MNNLLKSAIVASALLFLSFNYTSNHGPKWEFLGERIVNLSLDHDVIVLGAKEGVFTKLKFKVKQAPIFLHNITIKFGNNEEKTFVIKKRIKAGAESRVFDLPGNKRIIKKIKFLYKTNARAKKRAIIKAFGRH